MKHSIIILLFPAGCNVYAQQSTSDHRKVTIGLELDALPFITGGYYGSVWAGYNHFRYRAILTQITTPAFMLKERFTDNKIQSYTAITDYFFAERFENGGSEQAWNIGKAGYGPPAG